MKYWYKMVFIQIKLNAIYFLFFSNAMRKPKFKPYKLKDRLEKCLS